MIWSVSMSVRGNTTVRDVMVRIGSSVLTPLAMAFKAGHADR